MTTRRRRIAHTPVPAFQALEPRQLLSGATDGLDPTSLQMSETAPILSATTDTRNGNGYRPGDADCDGDVDLADLGILGANWRRMGAHWSDGDFNSDSRVDLSDLAILAMGWNRLYVDSDPTDGTWPGAYRELRDALASASPGAEIWVAAGTYKTTSTMNRYASFHAPSSVSLYGGFRGGEIERDQRQWAANETILSGDIARPGDPWDNSFHVVVASHGMVLDGFTITGGCADGSNSQDRQGGGLLNLGTSVTVANCVFEDNRAEERGGGVSNEDASVTFTDCVFQDNSSSFFGGGMYNFRSDVTLTRSRFVDNQAGHWGGGWYNDKSVYRENDCTFNGNLEMKGYGNSGEWSVGPRYRRRNILWNELFNDKDKFSTVDCSLSYDTEHWVTLASIATETDRSRGAVKLAAESYWPRLYKYDYPSTDLTEASHVMVRYYVHPNEADRLSRISMRLFSGGQSSVDASMLWEAIWYPQAGSFSEDLTYGTGWHTAYFDMGAAAYTGPNFDAGDVTGLSLSATATTSSGRVDITFDQVAIYQKPSATVYPSSSYHVLTLDDAPTNQAYAYAYSLGKGIQPSVALVGSMVGTPGGLTLEQVKAFASAGVEFCNHTWDHPDSTSNPPNWGRLPMSTRVASVVQMQDWMYENGLARGARVLVTPQAEWDYDDENFWLGRYIDIVRLAYGGGSARVSTGSIGYDWPRTGVINASAQYNQDQTTYDKFASRLESVKANGGLMVSMTHYGAYYSSTETLDAQSVYMMKLIDDVYAAAQAGEIECVTLGDLRTLVI